ncbi:MAG: hypothetical protein IPK83_02565 [Planctomycetes bacterium]|nr:hypothetical protein [Planctomycetota bacterium]
MASINTDCSRDSVFDQFPRDKRWGLRPAAVFVSLVGMFLCANQSLAQDCNSNGIPDACELSCGTPGGPCDVAGCGTASDCYGNGVPDVGDLNLSGSSLDFTNQFVKIPRSISLEPTQYLTIEVWVRPDSNGGSNNRIVRNATFSGPGYILAGAQDTNGARFQLRISGAAQGFRAGAGTSHLKIHRK